MLSKLSLVASTLGLTVVGAGVEVQTPLHITQTDLAAAYSFETRGACEVKIDALYEKNPQLRDTLKCVR